MAVPTRITDLSATALSNPPAGTDNIGTSLDDYYRAGFQIMRGDLASKGADIASAATTDLGAVQGLFHDITGTTTITSFGTVAAGIWKVLQFDGALILTHHATALVIPGGANITTATGDMLMATSEGSGNWRVNWYVKASGLGLAGMGKQLASGVAITGGTISGVSFTQPTRTVLTSGSGTYTTPAAATRISVRLVGAGGGGRDAATGGGTGGNTTFSTLTGSGGVGGVNAGGQGGAGGAAAGGDINIPGGSGQGAGQNSSASVLLNGGNGGNSAFGGGGGGGGAGAVGLSGATNSGGGGGGSGVGAATNGNPGGGAGGYVEKTFTSPAASYSYSVGAAGTAGNTNTGAAGIIIVDEYYT